MIVQYDSASGAILALYTSSDDASLDQYRVGDFVETEDLFSPETSYVVAGVITPRPAMGASQDLNTIAANASTTMTISGVPSGCDVVLWRAGDTNPPINQIVTTGFVAFTTNTPGTYYFFLQLFPHLDQTFQVTAT